MNNSIEEEIQANARGIAAIKRNIESMKERLYKLSEQNGKTEFSYFEVKNNDTYGRYHTYNNNDEIKNLKEHIKECEEELERLYDLQIRLRNMQISSGLESINDNPKFKSNEEHLVKSNKNSRIFGMKKFKKTVERITGKIENLMKQIDPKTTIENIGKTIRR